MARVSRAWRKKLDGEDGMLGANQELRGSLPQLLRDDPGGGMWTGMPASHEINRWVSAIPASPIQVHSSAIITLPRVARVLG